MAVTKGAQSFKGSLQEGVRISKAQHYITRPLWCNTSTVLNASKHHTNPQDVALSPPAASHIMILNIYHHMSVHTAWQTTLYSVQTVSQAAVSYYFNIYWNISLNKLMAKQKKEKRRLLMIAQHSRKKRGKEQTQGEIRTKMGRGGRAKQMKIKELCLAKVTEEKWEGMEESQGWEQGWEEWEAEVPRETR